MRIRTWRERQAGLGGSTFFKLKKRPLLTFTANSNSSSTWPPYCLLKWPRQAAETSPFIVRRASHTAGDKPAAPSPDRKEPEKLKTLLKQRLEVAKESFDAHQKGALGEGVRVTEPPYPTEEDGCHSSQTVSPSPAFLQRGLNLNPRRRT